MKKLTAIIFAIVICLLPLTNALAVDTATENPTIDILCTVNKPGGVDLIAEDLSVSGTEIPAYRIIKLKNGQEVTIKEESKSPTLLTANNIELHGITYALVSFMEDTGIEARGYMDITLLKPKEKSISKVKGVKLSNPDNYYLLKGSLDVYQGPSRVFKKTGTIPEGAYITVTHGDNEGIYCYGYVKYKDIEGWIYTNPFAPNCALTHIVDENSYLAGKLTVNKKGLKLVDIFDIKNGEYNPVTDELPVGTDLKYKFYSPKEESLMAYTEYKGQKGWIPFDEIYDENSPESSNCVVYIRDIGFVTKQVPIYSEPYNLKSETDMVILSHTNVNIDAYSYRTNKKGDGVDYWIKVNVGDKNGWIPIGGDVEVYKSNGCYIDAVCTEGTIPLYKEPNLVSGQVHTIYNGENYVMYHYVYKDSGYWNFCVIDGVAGWAPDSQNYSVVFQSISGALRFNDDGTVYNPCYTPLKSDAASLIPDPNEDIPIGNNTVIKQYGKVIFVLLIVVVVLILAAFIGIGIFIKKREKNEKDKYVKTE